MWEGEKVRRERRLEGGRLESERGRNGEEKDYKAFSRS